MQKVVARVILILGIITAVGAAVLFGFYFYLNNINYYDRINERTKQIQTLPAVPDDYYYEEPEEKSVELKEEDFEDSLGDLGATGEGTSDGATEAGEASVTDAERVSTKEDLKPPYPGVEYFYYNSLDDTGKQVYFEVYSSLKNREKVRTSTASTELLDKVFKCVIYDHPEIFYVDRYTYTTYRRGNSIIYVDFEGAYTYSKAECDMMMTDIDNVTDEWLRDISLYASDYDKINYVFRKVADEVTYSRESKDNQNMASVFLDKESACAGYSKAVQYMLYKIGINAITVTGEAAGGGHAWNMVQADGEWYHIDVTWGDVDYQENIEEGIDKSVLNYNYDYFLVTSDDIERTHRLDNIVRYPICTANDDNYYVHEGLYFTQFDEEKVKTAFANAYNTGEGVVRFKCNNDKTYGELHQYLLEDQNIFDHIRGHGQIAYMDNPSIRTIWFWL